LPLISTEWHEIALARYSLKHPWSHCSVHSHSDGETICSGHGAHSCAMCDFSYAKMLLFEALAPSRIPVSLPAQLPGRESPGVFSFLLLAIAVRGPPSGHVLFKRLARAC
jgi:hypothetical protein